VRKAESKTKLKVFTSKNWVLS